MSGEPIAGWDNWRERYNALTDQEQRDYYNAIEKRHPNQRHFNLEAISRFLAEREGVDVLEIGGWDGELADTILAANPRIKFWENRDICGALKARQVCRDKRYQFRVMDQFRWWESEAPPAADTLIASHFIEHISDEDALNLFRWIGAGAIKHVLLDAPIDRVRLGEWGGYQGTHILTMSWAGITSALADYGFTSKEGAFYYDR